jgi:hypothetical protein
MSNYLFLAKKKKLSREEEANKTVLTVNRNLHVFPSLINTCQSTNFGCQHVNKCPLILLICSTRNDVNLAASRYLEHNVALHMSFDVKGKR